MSAIPSPSMPARPSRRRPWVTWIMGTLFALGILYWWAGARTIQFARSWVADHYAQQAQDSIRQKNWAKASENVARARSWLVQHPPVIRAYADLLIATRNDDLALLKALQTLDALKKATAQDRLHMARILISLGHTAAARAEYEKLTSKEKQHHGSLELQANLLFAEGCHEEAEKLMRRALAEAPDMPELKLKLAILDHQNGFAEMKENARQQLWLLAKRADDTGLQALEFLAVNGHLAATESDLLLALAEAHPTAPPALRYTILSACLKARPLEREALLKAEAAKVKGAGVEKLTPALSWFLQENQAQTVIDLMPGELPFKSAPLLHAYLLAMSSLDRWPDIEKLLTGPRSLPVSQTFLHLWKARSADKLDHGIQAVRHHLEAAFAQTTGGQDETSARLTADTAEQMSQWDLAARFYNDIADLHPMSRGPMLEKAYAMALLGRDTDAALKATVALVEMHPENRIFDQRLLYLKLLSGVQMEQTLQTLGSLADPEKSTNIMLLQALAAYRLGDPSRAKAWVTKVPLQTDLPPGLKAVLAGLLAAAGETGPAFRLAEGIPAQLLLPEELRFLKRAL